MAIPVRSVRIVKCTRRRHAKTATFSNGRFVFQTNLVKIRAEPTMTIVSMEYIRIETTTNYGFERHYYHLSRTSVSVLFFLLQHSLLAY
jgi:hypothetical protein